MALIAPPPNDPTARLKREVASADESHHANTHTRQAALHAFVEYWKSKFSLSHNNWIIPSQKMILRLRELIAPLPAEVQMSLIGPFERPVRYYLDTAQLNAIRDLVPSEYPDKEALISQVIVTSKCSNFTFEMYEELRKLIEARTDSLVPTAQKFLNDNLIFYSQHSTFMEALSKLEKDYPEVAKQVTEIGCRQFDMQIHRLEVERWKTTLTPLGSEVVDEALALIDGARWCYFRDGEIARAQALLREIDERPRCTFSSYLPHIATMRRQERRVMDSIGPLTSSN